MYISVFYDTKLKDPSALAIKHKAEKYHHITLKNQRIITIYSFEDSLQKEEIEKVIKEIFKKPSKTILINKVPEAKYGIWISLKPGVKDNEGEVAKEAVEFILGKKLKGNIYVSKLLFLDNPLSAEEFEKIKSLISNSNIEICKEIKDIASFSPEMPIVKLSTKADFKYINFNITEEEFKKLNEKHNWALSVEDFKCIKEYFYNNEEFKNIRKNLGLEEHPTDVEIECLAQALSDHCAHRTFHGKFYYENKIVDDPFEIFIKQPTAKIANEKEWVVSVLKDNAGAMFLDKDGEYIIAIKGETHNSPSNKEPYGGSYTGIAGVYRDIMGFGKGAKVVFGLYGFVVAPYDYSGALKAELHPRQLLDGVIAGVKDGGNKHGIPTIFGNVVFDESFLGKSLVYVACGGIAKRILNNEHIKDKDVKEGYAIVIYGGRTGIDGIHGVTEASMQFSEKITMGHVQKGDSYVQRKVSELQEEAIEKGIIRLSWDLGGGGLSSAISETARFTNGAEINLENVRLKYKGLELWQIWVSESQERMLAAVPKEKLSEFEKLAKKHDVEFSVVGTFKNIGALHIKYNGKTCAYLPLELLYKKPPQWEFKAKWIPPENRLKEPFIDGSSINFNKLILDMLDNENICSKEWIFRQYDHEVKGSSVIKHYCGIENDVDGPAAVIKLLLDKPFGVAVTQTINPFLSQIDTKEMTLNVIDEALRRIASVGGVNFDDNGCIERVGLVDNYCWPSIKESKENPDAAYKAAQLLRSLEALKEVQEKLEIPFLSGKDSMYIDGKVVGPYGEKHRVSGLPSLQITAVGIVDDVKKAVSMEFKVEGDLVYIIGTTKNELGASAFYKMLGYTGLNIPKVELAILKRNLKAISECIKEGLLASCMPLTRGGLAIALAKATMASMLGIEVKLENIPTEETLEPFQILFSESPSRFIVSINPKLKEKFEEILKRNECIFACIGKVCKEAKLKITNEGKQIVNLDIRGMKRAYKKRFGDLI